ncbi:MAG: DUF296 domain-containing protein [Thermoplasmata archaeon]
MQTITRAWGRGMHFGKEANVYVIKLDDGEEVHSTLERLFAQQTIKSGVFLGGVGMLTDLKLGYYDGRDYVTRELSEPHELVKLSGSTAWVNGKPHLHLHAAVANKEHQLLGGHLVSAKAHYLNEIYLLRLVDIELTRKKSEKSGLMELIIQKASETKPVLGHVARQRSGSLELDLD